MRASCSCPGRWTLTWFDLAIDGASAPRARRRCLLQRLGDGVWPVSTTAGPMTFVPVLAPDEPWGNGGTVLEDLAGLPGLIRGSGVFVEDGRGGLFRPI